MGFTSWLVSAQYRWGNIRHISSPAGGDAHSGVAIIQGNVHNFTNTPALQLLVQVFEIQRMWGRGRLILQTDAWEPFLWRKGAVAGHCLYSTSAAFLFWFILHMLLICILVCAFGFYTSASFILFKKKPATIGALNYFFTKRIFTKFGWAWVWEMKRK